MAVKSVKVHDDTHGALLLLKAKRRNHSIDQLIREMIRATTGEPVAPERQGKGVEELTKYAKG